MRGKLRASARFVPLMGFAGATMGLAGTTMGFAGATMDVVGAAELLPCVRGVAPASAEFHVDPHRHQELHGFAAEPRHQLGLLARRHRARQLVVHLDQRDDALAPDGAQPQLGVTRRRALDQRIQRGVDVGAAQPRAVPRMRAVLPAAHGLVVPARAGALGEDPGRLVPAPVPARAVIQLGVAEALGHVLERWWMRRRTNGNRRSY